MENLATDVASTSPDAAVIAAADSSPAPVETPSLDAGGVTTTEGSQETVAEVDPLADVPTLEELQTQVEQKVPRAEGLFKLRTAYEQLKAEHEPVSKFKPLTELGEPDDLKAAYERQQLMFSPVLDPATNQPKLDERGLQIRTSRPFFDAMEQEQPGFTARHFSDLLDYHVLDPATNEKDTMVRYLFKSLGLNPDRYDDYRNIDTLLTKNTGAVSADELERVAEGDREAYKTLPPSLRYGWGEMDEDTQRWHLDAAKERLEARQYREAQEQAKAQREASETAAFNAHLEQSIAQDLTQVRNDAITALREGLSKAALFSGDNAINEDYIDAVTAPLLLLLDPDLAPAAKSFLERWGVKIDPDLQQTMASFVTTREQMKRAEAYQDLPSAREYQRQSNGLQAKLMTKFNQFALEGAKRFGFNAKKIASINGDRLAAANARPVIPSNTSAPNSETYIDPRSTEAVMRDWQQSRAS